MRFLAFAALILLTALAPCAPLRVLDLTTATPSFPWADALADLGPRVEVLKPPADLREVDVLLLDAGVDPAKLDAPALEAFVTAGGGVLIAGLPMTLPETSALWNALGGIAPADVIEADLFPDDSGDWMWIPTQEGETPDHIRHIRKVIDIQRPIKRAMIRCTVDNLYWVFVNGKEVGYHWSWYDHELWDITGELKQGRNAIAFKGRNVDGPGGFFAQVGIEYEDGGRELVVSDKSWRFHIPEEERWAEPGFDDSSWRAATSITPMSKRGALPDRALRLEGEIGFEASHPICSAISGDRFAGRHTLRRIVPRQDAQVIARVGDQPAIVAREIGVGRALLINTLRAPAALTDSDLADDLLATSILWLGRRAEGLTVADATYPPPTLTRGAESFLSFTLRGVKPVSDCVLTATLRRDGTPLPEAFRYDLSAGVEHAARQGRLPLVGHKSEGLYELTLTATDAAGDILFRRDTLTEVKNAVNLALSIPSNRHVTAEGLRIDFRGVIEGELPPNATVSARIIDPRGNEVARPEGHHEDGALTWSYPVPNLAEGDYALTTEVTVEGHGTIDTSRIELHIVPPLDLTDFYATTMRLSPFDATDKPGIEREIDDIIAHGFNTLTFSGRRLGANPGSPYDYAEDYAQRKGMAVSYSFQGMFSILGRNALPPVSVFSEEYADAIRPRIEQAAATCELVPRLLNVQGYMDEPFQISGKTFDDRPPAQAEFKRRYGIDMPTREDAMKDPALWLKYVDFWSDCFATGWRQSYAMVKDACPEFWVELTHDSHNTFGAAGRGFKPSWAVDDVFHWGAPFDSVNYDIYPYLSTDYRIGKFREHPLPRIAGMHMAFAQMRNLAYTYDKKLGFWLESGWGRKLAPDSDLRQYHWSPRELTYTAIAAGCDYLNTFWGIPEDPRWWEAYRGVMSEVKSIAPLLTRSRVPRAKAAFLFPRTQHVLLQEEYWNVMVALEAFRQAYGELDCIHEDQLAQGKLDDYEILVLFDIHLMKRASAEAIRTWCERGGIIVADEVPALDELKQPLGIFEDLFGAREGARLLDFSVKDAYLEALIRKDENDAAPILNAIRDCLTTAPPPNVQSVNPDIEAAVRQTPEGATLVFVINHESDKPGARVTIPCAPAGGIARDLITGDRIGLGPGAAIDLQCPWGQTRLIGIFPSDPKGLAITGLPQRAAPGESVGYILTVGGEDIRGNYLLGVAVIGPDGKRREAFCGRTCTRNATCARTIRLPVNAQKGTWRIEAKSAWDGSEARAEFVVSVPDA